MNINAGLQKIHKVIMDIQKMLPNTVWNPTLYSWHVFKTAMIIHETKIVTEIKPQTLRVYSSLVREAGQEISCP